MSETKWTTILTLAPIISTAIYGGFNTYSTHLKNEVTLTQEWVKMVVDPKISESKRRDIYSLLSTSSDSDVRSWAKIRYDTLDEKLISISNLLSKKYDEKYKIASIERANMLHKKAVKRHMANGNDKEAKEAQGAIDENDAQMFHLKQEMANSKAEIVKAQITLDIKLSDQ